VHAAGGSPARHRQSDDRGSETSAYSTTPDGILRGRIYSGDDGSYDLRTIIPGHYLNGDQFRPAHIHVRVSAPGHALLTTQLYFEGDPYNAIDPFIEAPLIMPLADAARGGKQATFDFVIRSA
jgi:protocatechuate 3,4-dioxygenase beta subunit